MKNFETIAKEHIEFTTATFTEATALSSIYKLQAETEELKAELSNKFNTIELITEYADCFFCLIDSAARCGLSIDHIISSMEQKLEINKSRKWKKNPDNSYSHIK